MKVSILEDYEQMSQVTAQAIIDQIKQKPNSLLCLAGGHTPLKSYQIFVKTIKDQQIDVSQCSFVSLDEWVGLDREISGSCQETLYDSVFDHLPIRNEQICFFNGLATDMAAECHHIDNFIRQHGTIDLTLLGIGMNGHIGFNEPGVNPNQYSHIVDLDPMTQRISVKYFEQPIEVKQGITLGMKHIFETKTIILIANDIKKASIVKQTMEEEATEQVPSSLLQRHPHVHVILDQGAASLLTKVGQS
ncbi:glucosamine-6-phosphate isomerase [Seinonella peptonophila]|uniref:Glucosamine-6-phosphate isomerase n=1 Tax=Seinonella peptonophila TaxID=112248 RepID=A0A1M5A833_9BACL|nr:glucosamine-6-phosphate deaminase [Seinonella peptonophila]SHF26423.1 glucosamine-6-phosphate isomerase [Seinonella peptonophila]